MLSGPVISNSETLMQKQQRTLQHYSSKRKNVERCFDKAALSYDANAAIQQKVVSLLHKQIISSQHDLVDCHGSGCGVAKSDDVKNIKPVQAQISLDIGCGTGAIFRRLHNHFMRPDLMPPNLINYDHMSADLIQNDVSAGEQWLNLDLSHAMLNECRNLNDSDEFVASHFTQGDAYSLPIQTGVIQNVYSSMALQWCNTPRLVLAEISRVLSVSGNAHLAIMIDPSFSYISECWKGAGYASRINTFLSADNWTSALPESLEIISSKLQCIPSEHQNLRELLVSIKSVGANAAISNINNLDNSSGVKPLTRTELKAVEEKCKSQGDGFMLDYHLLFLHLRKI